MSAPSEPPADRVAAWLHDGRSAMRHDVSVGCDGDRLAIEGFPPVAFAALRRIDAPGIVFGRSDVPGWRLGFDAPPPPALLDRLPRANRYGGLIDRFGLWWIVLIGALVSALVIFGAIRGLDLVGRAIPYAWEQRLGDTISGDFGSYACAAPRGQKALDALARRLSLAARPMRVAVVDIPVVNAVALPGGRILIFNGLLAEASSPDELAGVLAHEIGHVDERHVMVALVRRFGLGLLLGSSGEAGEYGQTLIDARYSRGAEAAADSYSIEHLVAARISPAPTAAFFARLGRAEAGAPGLLTYLASHPPAPDRQKRFIAAVGRVPSPAPALSAAEWTAVRGMCAGRKADPDRGFRFRF